MNMKIFHAFNTAQADTFPNTVLGAHAHADYDRWQAGVWA